VQNKIVTALKQKYDICEGIIRIIAIRNTNKASELNASGRIVNGTNPQLKLKSYIANRNPQSIFKSYIAARKTSAFN